MLKRTITAVVCLSIFIPVLFFSGTEAGRIIFSVLLVLLAVGCVYDLAGCIGLRRKFIISVPSYIFTALVLSLILCFSKNPLIVKMVFAISFIYVFLTFSFSMMSSGNVRMSQSSELVAVTGYILIGFLCIVLTRYATGLLGNYLYMLIFLGAWTTDSGAYFIGVLFGKHKLIPGVSPHKTVEGAIGGILGCIAGYSVYGAVLSLFFNVHVHWVALIFLAVIISVVDQLGDLIASYIKREQNIKDFGNIFPGHGGVLDRFDSIIAIAPSVYCITVILPVQIFS